MAPGTLSHRERDIHQTISDNITIEDIMENFLEPADPWNAPNQEPDAAVAANAPEGFEDSFADTVIDSSPQEQNSYESNAEYLNYLEAKLHKIESQKKRPPKLTSRDVLDSLKDTKEKQMDWNFRQGISSSGDDTLDSDSSSGQNSLTRELRRKMFPEQHALNETELLHLLEHDAIEKIFNQLEKGDSME